MQREILKVRSYQNVLPIRKKVAAYARVSSEKESMLHSLSAQISYYSELIQNNPSWRYVGVYADEAKTGTKGERPEFQRLLEDCKQGKIDMVITKSVSRFARNTLIILENVRKLKEQGIDVYFEKENIHSMSEDGELMLTLLSSFAQEESRSVSENCKWRIRNRFKQGCFTHFYLNGYDFENNQIKIIPEEAETIKKIFDYYLSGFGVNAIARKLREDNIPTKDGCMWQESTVKRILRNEKYAGNLLLQKSFVADHISKKRCKNRGELPMYYVENNHAPIIDADTFQKVQDEISRRTKHNRVSSNQVTYPFSKKIKCGICGKNYRRKIAKIKTKYEKPVWMCGTLNDYGKKYCPSSRVPEETLEKLSVEVLNISKFDEKVFSEKIQKIVVPCKGKLNFVFKDGTEITKTWDYPSRSESWTEEMKEKAREYQARRKQGERTTSSNGNSGNN